MTAATLRITATFCLLLAGCGAPSDAPPAPAATGADLDRGVLEAQALTGRGEHEAALRQAFEPLDGWVCRAWTIVDWERAREESNREFEEQLRELRERVSRAGLRAAENAEAR